MFVQWCCLSERSLFAFITKYFIMFFLTPFLAHHFSNFLKIWCQKGCFWDPLGSQLRPKGHPKSAARRKGTRGAPRSFLMEFAWILPPSFVILDPFRYFFKFLARRRHSILRRSKYFLWFWQGFDINVSFISRVAKNRKEPAQNQAQNELLKTWSAKLQFA